MGKIDFEKLEKYDRYEIKNPDVEKRMEPSVNVNFEIINGAIIVADGYYKGKTLDQIKDVGKSGRRFLIAIMNQDNCPEVISDKIKELLAEKVLSKSKKHRRKIRKFI